MAVDQHKPAPTATTWEDHAAVAAVVALIACAFATLWARIYAPELLLQEPATAMAVSHHAAAAAATTAAVAINASLAGRVCNIPRRAFLSRAEFVRDFVGVRPVILTGPVSDNARARDATARSAFLRDFGGRTLRLSTANRFTGRAYRDTTLRAYVASEDRIRTRAQRDARAGNETLYFFGSTFLSDATGEEVGPEGDAGWKALLSQYVRPPYPSETSSAPSQPPSVGPAVDAALAKPLPPPPPEEEGGEARDELLPRAYRSSSEARTTNTKALPERVTLSFGMGGRFSGVPFHTHGAGFSEVLHGRKAWFLYPPGPEPRAVDGDAPSLRWVTDVYPTLRPRRTEEGNDDDDATPTDLRPHECTIVPGEILYFPSQWYHATLNLDPWTVFVSAFA